VWESNDLKSKKTPSYNTLNKGKAREYSKITLAFCACSLTVFFFLFFFFFFFLRILGKFKSSVGLFSRDSKISPSTKRMYKKEQRISDLSLSPSLSLFFLVFVFLTP
jgi:hypothetical protein